MILAMVFFSGFTVIADISLNLETGAGAGPSVRKYIPLVNFKNI